MIRSYKEIADTGLDDLYEVQKAFDNVHAIFTLMLQHFPEDSTGNAFAQLGVLEVNDWSTKVFQWCERMENELDDVDAEMQKAVQLPHHQLDLRSNDVAEAISVERKHATRWWTHLNEMRRRKELPGWVAADIGTHDEHDLLLESRKAVNQALFGSLDLGGDQPNRVIQLG
ncbi:hypothetical protein PUP66_23145 [Pseudomonas chlororaphis]|uniref:hypothetical protein n=1 Tax=Pseudomonas chlororaphis TaxID=587753 RepID=UPI000E0BADE1|nr:hypothetical protein [Pseudomonas chlororaphis]AZD17384.1 hypothetical protein C4K25_4473 [Pseudomonas chlororaphis]WDH45960.1 hypothetical protein PUP66_23145 [Pseudomonas chlororaphis]WDH57807.1 hypothetical protein PUP56_23150 [Pseudomonas chlororaphis]WQE17064.1 hypothetical protein U0007_21965 [Pseudomonas chlororaphis]